jgi:hypothetical protein
LKYRFGKIIVLVLDNQLVVVCAVQSAIIKIVSKNVIIGKNGDIATSFVAELYTRLLLWLHKKDKILSAVLHFSGM